MLVRYSAFLSFPGGAFAANYRVTIGLTGSNVRPPLFSDVSATAELETQPLTDKDGFISFYAAPGQYVALVGHESQPVPLDPSVTEPVYPGLWVHTQEVAEAVWTVQHHFGVAPSVDVIVGGSVVGASVAHPDSRTTVITLAAPAVGTAYLRR